MERTSAAVLIIELQRWLEKKKLTSGAILYTQWDWRIMEPITGRGQGIGVNAPVTLTMEGSALGYSLSYGPESAADRRLVEEFNAFLEERGYYVEVGYTWSFHLYPTGQPGRPERSTAQK